MSDRELTLPPLGARVRDFTRRLGIAGFWAWWTRELDALAPAAPRAALTRRRMRPVLEFASDHATLWRPGMVDGRPVMLEATSISLVGDAAANTAAGRAALAPLSRIVYGAPAAVPRVVISLPAHDVLRKKIVLPAAVEENFRQALAYDLDRHTPFKPEELYFDAAIVDRDMQRNTITVDLATVRRAAVDPALRHVASWGGEVAAVVPEPPSRAARSRHNLLPAEARTSASFWRRWQLWVPLAVLVTLVFAAVAIPLWQKRDYAMQLAVLADQARARAAVSETLRAQLNATVGDYNTALERKYAFPGALQVVGTVSQLLPDDTWLTQFEIKTTAKGKDLQRELLMRGETANAGRLVQLFEESQLFTLAGQRGPTTKIQPGPGEIFDLGAQLKPHAPPAPLVLAVSDKPADPPTAPAESANALVAPTAPVPASSQAAQPSPVPSAPAPQVTQTSKAAPAVSPPAQASQPSPASSSAPAAAPSQVPSGGHAMPVTTSTPATSPPELRAQPAGGVSPPPAAPAPAAAKAPMGGSGRAP
jgi:general secretion pathway protein L